MGQLKKLLRLFVSPESFEMKLDPDGEKLRSKKKHSACRSPKKSTMFSYLKQGGYSFGTSYTYGGYSSDTYGYNGSVYTAELLKLSASAATAIGLVLNPKLFQDIIAPKPLPTVSVPSCLCEECVQTQDWFWTERNQSKVIRPKVLHQQGPTTSFQAYSKVKGFSLNSQTPSSWMPDLEKARSLLNKHNVRRPKNKCFRVLDHGSVWRSQNCNERFRVVRWPGSNPPEWEKVGWMVSKTYYDSRKEASQAKKLLNRISEIMES